MMIDDDGKWHIDRKVPLALIGSMALFVATQTIAGVWWASSINTRLETLEARSTGADAALAALIAKNQDNDIAREKRISTVEAILPRVERLLEDISRQINELQQRRSPG